MICSGRAQDFRFENCCNLPPQAEFLKESGATEMLRPCSGPPNVRFAPKATELLRCRKMTRSTDLSIRCPLYPRKRTKSGHRGMSALCQKRTHAVPQNVSYSITSS